MRDPFHIIRLRPAALVLSWAVVGLVAVWPGAGAKPYTGPAPKVSRTADMDPVLRTLGDAVGADLRFGYEASLAAAGSSRPGPQIFDAEGIRKRVPRRYRLSFPGAVPDSQLLARAMRFQAALHLLPFDRPHDFPVQDSASPRAPPRPVSV